LLLENCQNSIDNIFELTKIWFIKMKCGFAFEAKPENCVGCWIKQH
jgi:hypothetical protein